MSYCKHHNEGKDCLNCTIEREAGAIRNLIIEEGSILRETIKKEVKDGVLAVALVLVGLFLMIAGWVI